MNDEQALVLSKQGAALHNLEAAIELFFNEGDVVAVYTLAMVSHRVLGDLIESKGMVDPILSVIRPDKVAGFKALWRKNYDFMRHADRNPDEKITFKLIGAEFAMIEACEAYRRLIGRTPVTAMYMNWFAIQNPDLYDESGREKLRNHPTAKMTKSDIATFLKDTKQNYRRFQQEIDRLDKTTAAEA